MADQDRGAPGGGSGCQLAQQPGLAHAGISSDEHRSWLSVAGSVERLAERVHLALPPDERGLEVDSGHAVHGATQGRHSGRPCVGGLDQLRGACGQPAASAGDGSGSSARDAAPGHAGSPR